MKKDLTHQDGFGLMEVLIAMLVIALGISGVYTLLQKSLSWHRSSVIRSQGFIVASDMLERLTLNRPHAFASDDYVIIEDNPFVNKCDDYHYPSGCESSVCTPQQLAAYDQKQWQFQLACNLPFARGRVFYELSGGRRVYTIEVVFLPVEGEPQPEVIRLSHRL
ncbi:hypothetical protein CI610_00924 [invertebrate metagenome]|uniref:Type IV pilus modification protein PilV n=1 Tax=invertebrate metagenome TaxID=1711999 RepID=A0A2H9TA74_9ZZZZ